MRVLMDFDGVLLDSLGTLEYLIPGFDSSQVDTYDFQGNIGVPREEVFKTLYSRRYYESVRPYNETKEALDILRGAGITAIPYTEVPPNPILMTIRNHTITELGMKGSVHVKTKHGKPLVDGVVAVFEDSPANLERWLGRDNVRLYLIDHTYNRDTNSYIRCKNIKEAVERFLCDVSS